MQAPSTVRGQQSRFPRAGKGNLPSSHLVWRSSFYTPASCPAFCAASLAALRAVCKSIQTGFNTLKPHPRTAVPWGVEPVWYDVKERKFWLDAGKPGMTPHSVPYNSLVLGSLCGGVLTEHCPDQLWRCVLLNFLNHWIKQTLKIKF